MKSSGPTRRVGWETAQPVSWRKSPRNAFLIGTDRPGPALTSGPGSRFTFDSLTVLNAVPSPDLPLFRRLFHCVSVAQKALLGRSKETFS